MFSRDSGKTGSKHGTARPEVGKAIGFPTGGFASDIQVRLIGGADVTRIGPT